jgi:hypothetical protein
MITRRNFLHASLMAGGLVAVPQFGRWFRPPKTRIAAADHWKECWKISYGSTASKDTYVIEFSVDGVLWLPAGYLHPPHTLHTVTARHA